MVDLGAMFSLLGALLLILVSAQAVQEKKIALKKHDGNLILSDGGSAPSIMIMSYLQKMNAKLDYLMKKVKACGGGVKPHQCKNVPKNCKEVLNKCGGKTSGVYTVKPDAGQPFEVYCDQWTSGGGWTVIQRRKDGSVNFYRGWHDYKTGFGNLKGEFWLGLDKIYRLTHQTRNRLQVELTDTKGNKAYAEYAFFAVSSERTKYQLSLGKYSGTAGDSLSYSKGAPFSTKDRDNDLSSSNCAVAYKGAWWYKSCHLSNLNGLYLNGHHRSYANGVNWSTWKGYHYSAKKAEMKIRPV